MVPVWQTILSDFTSFMIRWWFTVHLLKITSLVFHVEELVWLSLTVAALIYLLVEKTRNQVIIAGKDFRVVCVMTLSQ